jgi:hypothetical protein
VALAELIERALRLLERQRVGEAHRLDASASATAA